MEERTVSMFNSVPSFARGSDILLVHSDTFSLRYLSSLLRQCSFKVTATNQASAAIDMVCQQEGKFKLVMAKANMPDTSTLSFLNSLILKEIPVIFISSGQNDGVARAALDKGLCYLLEEPIQPEDLIYVWQQVYYPHNILAREIQNEKCKEQEESENQNRTHYDVKGKKKRKRANLRSQTAEEGEETRENNNDGSSEKKPRISWTPDLHHKFVQAISVLGDQDIRPKEIQQLMNVPSLTCRHIASHLQKFKSQVRRLQEMCNTDLPLASESSNFSGRTTSSSSFKSQSYQGYPTLAAFQNKNQNQNQSLINSIETQGPEIFTLQETPGNANFSFQHPAELINYGNEDLYAVVGGAAPDALIGKNQYLAEYNNISKFLGEDSDKYECFGSGSTPDDAAQNSEVLKNSTFGNSSSSQHSGSCNTSCVSPLKTKPSATVGGLDSDASTDQKQTLTKYNKSLIILGEDSIENDCFGKEPYDIAQNSEILGNSILGNSFSLLQFDNCNPSSVRPLKAKPSAVVGGNLPDSLTDQNQTLKEYNSVLRFLGEDCEGYDSFGKGLYDIAQNSQMLKSFILENSFGLQQSDNYNPSCGRLWKAKPDALMDQTQTLTEYNNTSRSLGEDCEAYDCFGKGLDDIAQNSEILKSSISGNSFSSQKSPNCSPSCVSLLKANPSAALEGPEPDALMDQNHTLTKYNNSLRILGEKCEGNDCFGKGPYDIAKNSEILRNSIIGNSPIPQQVDNCNRSSVRPLKAKTCAVVGGTMPDALIDHDQTLAEYNNIISILGDDSDEYDCFGNESSPGDFAILRNSIFGDSSSPQQSDNCNTSRV